jgi:hypothetical protein
MVQVLFYLTFEDFAREIGLREQDGSLSINRQGRTIRTVAGDWVLQAAYGDVDTKAARKHIADECRWGHRWWKVASYDGLGLLLLASDGLAKYMYLIFPVTSANPTHTVDRGNTQFQLRMVEALAIYIRNTLPNLVTLLRSLASVTQNIMLGRSLTVCECSEITNLLEGVAESDLYNQCYPERWESYTPEEAAKSAATEFRRSANIFSYEAARRRHDGNMSCIMGGS